jgi:hypothetical protein
MMRWGLVPFFARAVPPKYSTINATPVAQRDLTVEHVTTAPADRNQVRGIAQLME